MLGFALMTGLAAFMGVRIALRHGLRHGGHGCGRRFGTADFEGEGPGGSPWQGENGSEHVGGWGRGFGGRRGRWILRAIMNRIGARPDQEETIREAMLDLEDTATKLRGEGRKTRQDLAEA